MVAASAASPHGLAPASSQHSRIPWHCVVRRASPVRHIRGGSPMRRIIGFSAFLLAAAPASAALPSGTKAPQVEADGAAAGKPYKLNLQDQLKHGPVVLYFFPKAGTTGCDLEAHAF